MRERLEFRRRSSRLCKPGSDAGPRSHLTTPEQLAAPRLEVLIGLEIRSFAEIKRSYRCRAWHCGWYLNGHAFESGKRRHFPIASDFARASYCARRADHPAFYAHRRSGAFLSRGGNSQAHSAIVMQRRQSYVHTAGRSIGKQ
jgi:hypothetical protein